MPIVLMLLIVGVLGRLIQTTTTQSNSIDRSLTAIAQAQRVLALFIDFGDSWANYKLTSDAIFLRSFERNRARLPGELARLRRLAGATPRTMATERQVEEGIQEWIGAKQLIPPILDSGGNAWRLAVNVKLNQVRSDVALFVSAEREQLDQESQNQRSAAVLLSVTLGGSAFLAALILSYQSWRTIGTLSGRYERALSEVMEKSLALEKSNAELDKRVEERTNELNIANQELEMFCFSAAHDLRAPLRSIIGGAQIFIEDYGDLVPSGGLKELRRVSAAASRLSKLVDSLLELARLGRAELKLSSVNLSEICGQSVLEVQSREWSGPVSVNIQPDIYVQGDPVLLSILAQNLIENAFKFCSGAGNGRIDIESKREGKEVVVSVRDNGVGFDDHLSDQLFQPFHRLHSDSEFSGTGMGLANAKRVVDRHGGRIWAESKIGEGATFHFALPWVDLSEEEIPAAE